MNRKPYPPLLFYWPVILSHRPLCPYLWRLLRLLAVSA